MDEQKSLVKKQEQPYQVQLIKMLKAYSNKTGIPISKILDRAIIAYLNKKKRGVTLSSLIS